MQYSHYDIAAKAYQMRDSLGACAKGIENIFRLLEVLGYSVFRYP